ncbi:small ribosomal subunit protein bS18m-like [Dasypus novemcinctus]|uniref:small ribosomal subunit protein bS18m-like n=1 Tax=Dasypus novemcinctus TaxID=9361 RepID=UPI0039C8F0BB
MEQPAAEATGLEEKQMPPPCALPSNPEEGRGRIKKHVLWRRGCSQHKQVTSHEDLPIPMENPFKEPLKKCILCGKCVDYKNVQVFVGRNRKKSQKQLRGLK